MNSERLRNVVRAVREGREEDFNMSTFGHACGTPACALGHYAAREDLQSDFSLSSAGFVTLRNGSNAFFLPGDLIADHFGLPSVEAWSIFSVGGCNGAKTRKEAIAYIEDFIAKHEAVEELIQSTKEEQHEFVQR